MRIVVAGGSGFLGTALRRRLANAQHDVVQLVRTAPADAGQVRWRPDKGALDPAVLDGVDAVINLAGAGAEDKRWNAAYKQVLVDSRVDTTRTIATAIAAVSAPQRPRVFLNASGVHFYGDTGDTAVDESSPPGQGFFPELCQVWEAATAGAEDVGVRVVKLRTGLVLDRAGGLLKPMRLAFRAGVGGPMAGGRQWMPWITLDDWVSAALFALGRDDIVGAVNLVGPAPARNAEFTKALARAVHRPAVFPLPRFALRIALGEFGNDAVASLRVLPGVLSREGFRYAHPDLTSALRAALHQR
jgi:uncharacterized protein (TIGR01777 family)